MNVSEFKEELSKKLLAFQQKLFNVDDLDELKNEVEELKSDLTVFKEDIIDQIVEEDTSEEEEEEEESDNDENLDQQIKNQEKSLPSGNSSLLNEQEKLRKELGG